MTERVSLTLLPRVLSEHTGKSVPRYRKLYNDALDGAFPADKDGGRWTFLRKDLDAIAEHYGLMDQAA